MRYYITDNNMKSTLGIRDIPYFQNVNERNQWVSDNLLNGQTLDEALATSIETNTQILNIQNTTIQVEYTPALANKNYVIVKDDISNEYLFYIITDKNMFNNSNMITLTLELDALMTYPTIIDNLENFELIKGHSSFNNYFDYEFDGGRKYIKEIRKKAHKGIQTYSVIVYRKLHSNEEGVVINGITLPYKIFIAQAEPLNVKDANGTYGTISKEDLIEYYNKAADGLTYNIQIVPYTFFQYLYNDEQSDATAINDWDKGNEVVHYKNILELKKYNFNGQADKESNTYSIGLGLIQSAAHNFNTLPGLEDTKLAIEGVKEIDWPFNQVDTSLNDIKLRIGTFLAPNEMENFYTFNDQPYYRDSENTWTNETELSIFVNQLNEYKANNPISSKLGILGSAGLGAVAGAGLGAKAGKGNPEMIGAGAATGALAGVAGTMIGRANKKRKPETVKGDTNTYGILSNAAYPFQLVELHYEYKGKDRDSIFNLLYKYGLDYDTSLLVDNYNEIKRPIFNFIKLSNLSNSQLNMELPNEVINALGITFAIGIRVWNDTTKYLQYESDLSGNGDKV